jgi:PAS domain S-box-containing protein
MSKRRSGVDTTKRTDTEQAQRLMDERFRALIENASDVITVLDAEGIIRYASPSAKRVLGYKPEELIGTNIAELLHPDDLSKSLESYEAVKAGVRSGDPLIRQITEDRLRHKDGSWRILEGIATGLDTPSGAEIVINSRDITERERAEYELKKILQLLNDTGEMAKVGGWELDLSTKEVLWTEEVRRIHRVGPGYRPKLEEALNFYAPESRPAIEEALKKAAEIGEPYDLESLFIPSGSKDKIWVRSLGRAVYSGDKIVKLAGTFQNIDKRKRIEEALQASEQKHRELFETMAQGAVCQNAEGHIISANPAAERLLGLTLAEMLGRTSMDPRWKAIHEDGSDFPGDTHPAMIALKTGKEVSNVVMGVFHPGANGYVWINMHAVPQFRPGETQPYQVYTTFDDFTERRRAEEALRVSHRFLEIANRHTEMMHLLKEFVAEVRNFTGCVAVGLRMLDAEGKIPYLAYEGFDQRFYESESPLSIGLDQCMCINVIKGTTDPKLSFYTEGGSFYMNGTTRFLATVSEEEKGRTRNVCNQFGYESVALVPIRAGDNILGLIHVADYQENMVPLEMVHMLEGTAMQLGTAILRVRAEEALRESEERFRSLVENATVGIYRTTPEGRILMANPTLVRMLGYENFEGLAARNLEEEGFEAGCSRRKFCERMEQDGEVSDLEAAWTRRDGSVLCIRESARAIRSQDGKITHYDGIVEDITERKRAEEALRESRSTLNLVLDTVPQSIFWKDLEGRYLGCNRVFAVAAGLDDPARIVGKTDFDLPWPREEAEAYRTDDRAVIEENRAKLHTIEPRHRADGTRLLIDTSKLPLYDGQGRPFALLGVSEDITERNRTETRLKESEEKFRKAFMTGADAFYVATLNEGLLVEVNDSFQELYGYRREEVIGKTSSQLGLCADPLDRSRVVSEVNAKGYVKNMELQARRKGGEIFTVLMSINILSLGGEPHILGVLRDITEQRRTEAALRASEAGWRALFASSPAGMVVLGSELRYVQINQTLAEMNGATIEAHIGKTIGEIVPRLTPTLEPIVRFVLATGEMVPNIELSSEMAGQPGILRHWVASFFPIAEPAGSIASVGAIVVEITDRKRAEEAVRASEERFRRAINAAEAGLWEWDILTDQTFYSPRWCEIVGYSFDDPELPHTYNSWASRIHPDDYDRVMSDLNNHLEKGTKYDVDYRHLHRSGEYRWQNSRGQKFLDERGKPIKMVGCISDITERRRAEQTLQASIKQLRSLAKHLQKVREEERKDLAREIHDELGQALTGLKMDLAWLRRNLPQAAEQDRRFLIEKLDSLVRLTDQPIAEVHRLATQLRPPLLDDLGLEAAMEWQVSDFQRRTGINCEFVSTLEGLKPDPDRSTAFFRILQEALTNVVRHTQATQIKVRLGKGDGAFLMEVEDNGGGITKNATHDSKSLGLIGMRERALAFDGEVTFSGQRGKGTTIKVLIPIESPERESWGARQKSDVIHQALFGVARRSQKS